MNFNRVILMGRLTRDPELRFTSGGIPVCSFGLAVNRRKPQDGTEAKVDFVDITAWRELGETIANYKKKGDPILVEGRLQYSSWEAQDGSKRSKVDVVADNVQFVSSRSDGDSANGGEGQRSRSAAGARSGASGGGGRDDVDLNEEDFDDIPFAHLNVKRLQVRDVL